MANGVPDWYGDLFSNSYEIPLLLQNQNDKIGAKQPAPIASPINALDIIFNGQSLGFGGKAVTKSNDPLAGVETSAPFSNEIRSWVQGQEWSQEGTAPGAGIPEAVSDYIGRGAIIVLGLIFVAVGLAMFKPGVVIAAGQGFGQGVKEGLAEAG